MSTIKVKMVRSQISTIPNHRRILASLGFRKINQVRELKDCPEIRGQIKKVDYLLQIVD